MSQAVIPGSPLRLPKVVPDAFPMTPPKAVASLASGSAPKVEQAVEHVLQTPPRAPTQNAALLSSPEFRQLATPDKAHSYQELEASPSKVTGDRRKELLKRKKSLPGKAVHTMASPSVMKRDTDRIRVERVQPDEKERFLIDSPDKGLRAYKRHKKLNPQGKDRLFPVTLSPPKKNDPSVVSATGQEVINMLGQWKQQKNIPNFKAFVLSQSSPPSSGNIT